MSIDELNHSFTSTQPPDKKDPPRFGHVKEVVKDVLIYNLRDFFTRSLDSTNRLDEIPSIERFSVTGDGSDPYESVLRVVRRYPDVLQRMPHVVVLSTTLSQQPFSVGPPLLAAVQYPPRLLATNAEPYNIQDGDRLVINTTPPYGGPNLPIGSPRNSTQVSSFLFRAVDMPLTSSVGSVGAADAASMINAQALFVHATVLTQNGLNYLQIETGGTMGQGTPNSIEVQSDSTASLLSTFGFGRSGTAISISGMRPTMSLIASPGTFSQSDIGENQTVVISGSTSDQFNDGRYAITSVSNDGSTLNYTNEFGVAEALPVDATWFIGQKDDSMNPSRPPANRYGYMFDVGVQIQVLADDDQTRDQVSDLVTSFLTFFAEQQFFTFLGRSIFDPSIIGEHYQIVIKSDLTSSSEDEMQVGGSQYDKLYADVFGFTCHVSQYLDRTVLVQYGPKIGQGWTVEGEDVSEDEGLPLPS